MADVKTKELLNEWKLSSYVDNFCDNNITYEILSLLDRDALNSLIPKIGDRILFETECQKHFTINQTDNSSIGEKRKSDNINDSRISKKSKTLVESNNFKNDLEKEIDDTIFNTFDVKEIISSCERGNNIITRYELKKSLTETDRNFIVDLVVGKLRKITKKNLHVNLNKLLQQVSQKIVDTFSTSETITTYYIPPIRAKDSGALKKSKPSKGKIPNKWRNFEAQFKITKIEEQSIKEVESVDIDVHIKESIEWLKSNPCIVQKEITEEHWKRTAEYRLSNWASNQDKNISNIFEDWEILKQSAAVSLIQSDFTHKKLTTFNIQFDLWNNFCNFLLKIAPLRRKDETAIYFQNILNRNNLSQDNTVATQLSLLSYSIPPKAVVKLKKGSNWKLSIGDSKDSLIQKAATEIEVNVIKTKRIECMKERKLNIQPYIIVVGKSINEITSSYVCIDQVVYATHSVLEALDLCFKIFHIFHVEYPIESKHLWLIIQKCLYRISTSYDVIFSHTENIIHQALKESWSEESNNPLERDQNSDLENLDIY